VIIRDGTDRLKVDYRTIWAFAHAEGLSIKKAALASEQ
jgi:hypothetical protein